MEQDIRKLFNTENETDTQLPLTHRAEFQNKLRNATQKQKQKPRFNAVYKYVAIALLFFAIGYVSIQQIIAPSEVEETALQLQLKNVEQQYLDHIDKEWENFKSLTNDNRLIHRYEQKLDELNNDYQELSAQFQEDRNNILVLESLIDNLKLRLQILKDIQQHIKLLNQKNEQHEIII